MKRLLALVPFAITLSGCSIMSGDFSTDWKKIDQSKLADLRESNGMDSLFLKLNEVGKWPAGQKVVFIEPSACSYTTAQNGSSYHKCNWMAEITDIRGTQLCVGVEGWKDYNERLGFQVDQSQCRWKDEIRS